MWKIEPVYGGQFRSYMDVADCDIAIDDVIKGHQLILAIRDDDVMEDDFIYLLLMKGGELFDAMQDDDNFFGDWVVEPTNLQTVRSYTGAGCPLHNYTDLVERVLKGITIPDDRLL